MVCWVLLGKADGFMIARVKDASDCSPLITNSSCQSSNEIKLHFIRQRRGPNTMQFSICKNLFKHLLIFIRIFVACTKQKHSFGLKQAFRSHSHFAQQKLTFLFSVLYGQLSPDSACHAQGSPFISMYSMCLCLPKEAPASFWTKSLHYF